MSRRFQTSAFLLIVITITLASALAKGASASAPPIHNVPGYITLERGSPYFQKKTCKSHDDGILRATPSCVLTDEDVGHVTADGIVRVDRIQARIAELEERRNVALIQFCHQRLDRSEADPAVCDEIPRYLERFECHRDAAPTGIGRIICAWRQGRIGAGYEAAIGELERAIQAGPALEREAKTLAARGMGPDHWLNSAAANRFHEALLQGLDIAESLKGEDDSGGSFGTSAFKYLSLRVARDVVIRDDDFEVPRPEAVNLMVSSRLRATLGLDSERIFLPPEELKRRGVDLGRLDPVDSGFWRRPRRPINTYRTRNYNGEVRSAPVELLDSELPIRVLVDEPRGSGDVPALSVRVGERLRYRMKFAVKLRKPVSEAQGATDPVVALLSEGTEIHAETAVNNLAAALGFTVEPAFFKRDVRLYLPLLQEPQGESGVEAFERARRELIEELRKHFGDHSSAWDLDGSFSDVRVDDEGRSYIWLDKASFQAESDPSSEIPVGRYGEVGLGRQFKREFRGFQLFRAWIASQGTRRAEAALKVLRTGDPDEPYKVSYSASDLGSSLGSNLIKDRPNDFRPDLVKAGTDPGEVLLNYHPIADDGLYELLTLADARWMTNLIAQLTPEQIREAFRGAGYHSAVVELFTQKLLRRRDQLVQALGLEQYPVLSEMKDPASYKVPGWENLFNERGEITACPDAPGGQNPPGGPSPIDPRHCQEALAVRGVALKGIQTAYEASAAQALGSAIGREVLRFAFTREFFVDGRRLEAGATSFAPARFSLENPDKSSPYPYWAVEVMRVGIGGGIHDPLGGLTLANFSVLKGQGYRVHEFIWVKPVKAREAIERAVRSYEVFDPNKYPEKFKQALQALREDSVKSLEPGEFLISSTYWAAGTAIYQPLLGSTIAPLASGVGAMIGVQASRLGRVLVIKEPGQADGVDPVIAVWEKLNQGAIRADATLKIVLESFPLLLGQLERREQKDRAYRFDLAQPEQARLLRENLTEILPELPPELEVERLLKRDLKTRKTSTLLNFFGLFSLLATSEDKRVSNGDAQGSQLVSRSDAYVRFAPFSFEKKEAEVRIETAAVLVEDKPGAPISTIKIRHFDKYGTRESFAALYDKWIGIIFPEQREFIRFQPKDAHYYLGQLELEGSLEFRAEALSDLFTSGLSRESLCRRFAATLADRPRFRDQRKAAEFARHWCERIVEGGLSGPQELEWEFGVVEGERALRQADESRLFLWSFDRARRAYLRLQQARASQDGEFSRKELAKGLQKINKLLKSSTVSLAVARTLSQLVSEKNLIRKLRLSSSLAGFPGQERVIELTSSQAPSEMAKLKREYEDLFVDRYFRHLENNKVFFNFFSTKPFRGAMPPDGD